MSALTTGATTYAFSFYSSALKLSLRLSQSELDTLGSATFAAGVFSWIPGMIVDRYGSKLGIVLGGMGNCCVLSLYWFIVTGRVWPLDSSSDDATLWLIFVLSILGVLTFMGCALITGSVFKLIVESCGEGSKGKAVGCAKGYVGVGSGVYVCLFRALSGISSSGEDVGPAPTALIGVVPSMAWLSTKSVLNRPVISGTISSVTTPHVGDNRIPPSPEIMNTLNFLLMAACFSFLAAVIPALVFVPRHRMMQSEKPRDGTRSIHFRVVYASLILLGLWVVGASLLELKEEDDTAVASGEGQMNVGPRGLPPSIVNKTVIFAVGGSLEGMPYDQYLQDEIMRDHNLHLKPQLFRATAWQTIRRLSSSVTQRHWGIVVLLLFLWWGPPLSLLLIKPRKDSYDGGGIIENMNEDDDTERDIFLNDAVTTRRPLDVTDFESTRREFTLIEMLRKGEAWLMAWTFLVLVGGGTLMTCNIGERGLLTSSTLYNKQFF